MYSKNLSEDLRLRLSKDDMDFLKALSETRACSVSECIRSIIGEYRRSVDAITVLNKALELVNSSKGVGCSDGNTKTDCVNQL